MNRMTENVSHAVQREVFRKGIRSLPRANVFSVSILGFLAARSLKGSRHVFLDVREFRPRLAS
jgi:hypothetical protein